MPPPNPKRLEPSKLVQLLNSHPQLGTVITIQRLRQHRLAAGLRISADGDTVDFFRYVAWLVQQRHIKPQAAKVEQAPAGDLTTYLDEKQAQLQQLLAARARNRT